MDSFNNKTSIFLSFFFAIRYPTNHTILIYIRSHENNRYFPNFEKQITLYAVLMFQTAIWEQRISKAIKIKVFLKSSGRLKSETWLQQKAIFFLFNLTFNQNQTLEKSFPIILKTLGTLKHFQYHWGSFLTQNYSLGRPQSAWFAKEVKPSFKTISP